MKKILFLLITLLLLAVIPASMAIYATESPPAVPEGSTAAEGNAPTETGGGEEATDPGGTGTFSAALAEKVLQYIGVIVAAVCTVITGTISSLIKKKILPGNARFAADVTEKVEAFKAKADELSAGLQRTVRENSESIDQALSAVGGVLETVKSLQKEIQAGNGDRLALIHILKTQAGLFHMILQSSTLPQWRKDEAGKMYEENMAELGKLLTAGENAGEANE